MEQAHTPARFARGWPRFDGLSRRRLARARPFLAILALALSSSGWSAPPRAAGPACGSVNPILAYGDIPYSGAWLAQHRDSRNSDFADCEISASGYRLERRINILAVHTTNVFPVISQDGTAWLTVSYRPPRRTVPNIYGVDLATGVPRVTLGAADGLDRSAAWGTPLSNKTGDIFIAQERRRPPGTDCRISTAPADRGQLCGEYLSFDRDGKFRWKTRTDGGALGSQMTPDGNIVMQTWRGTIHVLNPDDGALLDSENSFPAAAALLPDDLRPGVVVNCLFLGQTKDCIVANILAVHPVSGHLYNVVQAFVSGLDGALVQRWLYDPLTGQVILDPDWQALNLPGGSASSPVVDFSGEVLFVNDSAQGVYALDAETGTVVAYAQIPYSPAGSPAIAPDFAADGSLAGTYLMFYKRWEEGTPQPPSWITIIRYTPDGGFSRVNTLSKERSGNGVGWAIVRNPVAGLVDRGDMATPVRFATVARLHCDDCPTDQGNYLVVIDPKAGEVVSANYLARPHGTVIVGPDRTIIMSTKGDPDDPSATVRTLLEVYAPAPGAAGRPGIPGVDSGCGADTRRVF